MSTDNPTMTIISEREAALATPCMGQWKHAVHGCRRTEKCAAKRDEWLRISEMLLDGMTLREVGDLTGYSHERIRQVCKLAPNNPHQRYLNAERALREMRDEQERAARAARPCRYCGQPIGMTKQTHCSAACYRKATALRFIVSDEAWEQHAGEWCRVHRDDEWNQRGDRHVLVKSKTARAGMEAALGGYPIVDQFPLWFLHALAEIQMTGRKAGRVTRYPDDIERWPHVEDVLPADRTYLAAYLAGEGVA